ncbi:MAG: hypothetical protein WCS42_25400 [Verrucomicrobiota bacterium]
MNKLLSNYLAAVAFWFFLAGCSSLSPTPDQQGAAAGTPWTGAPEKPTYEGAQAVAGLLDLLK